MNSQPVVKQEQKNLEDVWIAIMGVTGAGKSKFIQLCTGQKVKVGHSLVSCTVSVEEYQFVYRDKLRIHLIDTPGFDDTNRTDKEVLDDIARWMGTSYSQDIRLSGILYLHRITDPRVGGVSRRNLLMFKKLCGEDCYPRIMLATTMWDIVDETTGIAREKELASNEQFFGEMVQRGSSLERHYGDRESAMDILKNIIKRKQTVVLRVQKEMVDHNLTLEETAAGREVSAEILRQREKFEKEIKAMREEQQEYIQMNELKAAEELARQQKVFEDKIEQGYKDQEKMRATLEDLQRQREEELRVIENQLAEAQAAMRAHMEDLDYLKKNLDQLDPSSHDAAALKEKIVKKEEEVEEIATNVTQQEEKVEREKRNIFIRAYEWMKNNPDKVAKIGMVSLKVVSHVAVAVI